jgi:diguanylate cyclase (GGDEF)-like protein
VTVDRHQDQAAVLAAARRDEVWRGRSLALVWAAVAVGAVVLAVALGPSVEDALDDPDPLPVAIALGVPGAVLAAAGGAFVASSRRAAAARAELDQLAAHDPITGLPNRQFLGAGLDEMLRVARRSNARAAALLVEVDGLAAVNESRGRDVGDAVVRALADNLRAALGPEDHLVRYGGAELMVLCPDLSSVTAAERKVARILAAVGEPIDAEGGAVRLAGSIGVALAEPRCSRPDELLTDANVARRQAVQAGHGRYALFDRAQVDAMTPSTAERLLREALEREEFCCYYQPIVSLWTRRLVGVEALVRWDSPTRGLVGPADFVPVLEDTGLIVPMGHWIIDHVCAQARRWNDDFPDRPPLTVKVNASARQLVQADFAGRVTGALAQHGVPPHQLTIEVSEASLVFDLDAAWATLGELREVGVGLAVDDFGTGFSSLSYLRELSVDVLNIDKSFIDGIAHSADEATVVRHVVALAKALGIVTVAEGVEDEEQVEVLRELSCDLAQGYYFSHAQPPDVIAALLASDGTAHEWDPGRDGGGRDERDAATPVPGRVSPHRADGTATHGPTGPEEDDEGVDPSIERFQRGRRR